MITIHHDLDIDPHTLYHVSPKLFSFPSRKEINRAREWSPWHSNGVLGLWCSTVPETCQAFGTHIYRVDLGDCRKIGLTIDQFYDLTHDAENFAPIIDYLCQHGDVAYIVDANPRVGEVIVLNLDVISAFEKVEGARDKKVRLDNRFYLTRC